MTKHKNPLHYSCFSWCLALVALVLSGCGDATKQTQKTVPQQPTKEQRITELSKGLGKNVNEMNIAELRRGKEFALLTDNKNAAIKMIDRMVVISTDQQEIAALYLERADLHFDLGRFAKAGKYYEEYLKMYPGSDKVDEVKYKTILCRFYQTLDIDRDQSKTKSALGNHQRNSVVLRIESQNQRC